MTPPDGLRLREGGQPLASLRLQILQLLDVLVEHVWVRRGRSELPDVLRAYGNHHRRRARSVPWAMDELSSVVVPCFNHSAFLETTLESIAHQTWRPLEVILVDDASTDATRELLPRLASKMPCDVETQIYRRQRNRGQTSTINFGVMRARGSVVTIVNDDDYLLHDAIAVARELMQRERVHLFGATSTWFETEVPAKRELGLRAAEIAVIRLSPEDIFHDPALLRITHTGSTFLRPAWHAVRGYRAWRRVRIVVPGDTEFHLRLASLFAAAVAPRAPFAYWRNGAESHDSEIFS